MLRRTIVSVVAAVLIAALGASTASAWTFATRASPQSAVYNGVSFGDGAGNIYRWGFNYVYVDVELKDPVPTNGRGVYEDTYAWWPAQTSWTGASVQTGRRNVNSWAAMQRQTINTTRSSIGIWARSKVCEDAPWRPDICSTSRTSPL